MQHRYDRNLGVLTAEDCRVLQSKRVFVAGCGGLGGYVIELLARLGVGAITAADGDVFEETNLNRQLLCEEALLGKNKAQAAKERIQNINSGVTVQAVTEHITEKNAAALLYGHDIAVDALDTIPARRTLAHCCRKLGIPMVHGAVGGWSAQVSVIQPGDNTLDVLFPPDSDARSLACPSFTPALAASIQTAEAVKVLLGRKPDLSGKLLCVDLLTQISQIIELKK